MMKVILVLLLSNFLIELLLPLRDSRDSSSPASLLLLDTDFQQDSTTSTLPLPGWYYYKNKKRRAKMEGQKGTTYICSNF